MQLGFNTNFRYRDVVFHVQTEDSGRANPHVITHLFHGGNIIASVKRDYADLLAEADLEGAVRKLMESQHKSMLKRLSRGEFDAAIRERLGSEIFAADRSDTDATGGTTEGGRSAATATRSPSGTTATSPAAAPPSPSAASARSTPGSTPTRAATARAVAEPTVVAAGRPESTSGLARVFGERVVSEKPLDEVVLEYLVENARKRKRPPKS
ncbi:MAG: hypothetical protein R3F35_14120 [Myxococcota bacterium]